jgi:hypothetical protein
MVVVGNQDTHEPGSLTEGLSGVTRDEGSSSKHRPAVAGGLFNRAQSAPRLGWLLAGERGGDRKVEE